LDSLHIKTFTRWQLTFSPFIIALCYPSSVNMKAVLSIAALVGAAHIGLVAGEQLKLGDQCVVYAKDSAGVYRMNVTSCDGAPDFTWDGMSG
jgi:hypothetical protein